MSTRFATDYYQSAEDYLGAERLSDQKHEYLAGVIYAMAGASLEHDLLAGNIYSELRQQLRQPGCNVFSSDVKTRIRRNAAEFYYYPDVTVDCSGRGGSSYFLEDARVIFEVLSPDTERIDRGEKLSNYQSLASLGAYVLVDQFHLAVTAYRRSGEGWAQQFLTDKESVLELPQIDCLLPLTAIYARTHLMR